jgi:PAS domain-containing protein
LDFPTEAQRLFLRTGANQVAIAVDRWRAEIDERRFAALVERSADFIAFASLEGVPQYGRSHRQRFHERRAGPGGGHGLRPVALRALDQLAAGVIVRDGAGRVIELNRAAERIVRRGDGLIMRDSALSALGVRDAEKLAKLIVAS